VARSFHPQVFILINASVQNWIVGGNGGEIITSENTMPTPSIAWYARTAIRSGECKTAAISAVTGRIIQLMSRKTGRTRSGATADAEYRIL
jgi:hypothetical protein